MRPKGTAEELARRRRLAVTRVREGYPVAEVSEDGSAIITKAPGTGGRVNFDTVRQQLLYEVHDPHAYLSPDVVLDMSTLHLDDLGDDRVRLTGATGRGRPERLKRYNASPVFFRPKPVWIPGGVASLSA